MPWHGCPPRALSPLPPRTRSTGKGSRTKTPSRADGGRARASATSDDAGTASGAARRPLSRAGARAGGGDTPRRRGDTPSRPTSGGSSVSAGLGGSADAGDMATTVNDLHAKLTGSIQETAKAKQDLNERKEQFMRREVRLRQYPCTDLKGAQHTHSPERAGQVPAAPWREGGGAGSLATGETAAADRAAEPRVGGGARR